MAHLEKRSPFVDEIARNSEVFNIPSEASVSHSPSSVAETHAAMELMAFTVDAKLGKPRRMLFCLWTRKGG